MAATVTAAVATAEAASAATVIALAAKAAALLAVLVQAEGHERVNHLVEKGDELGQVVLAKAGDEVLALALEGLGALDGVLVGHDDDLAHVGLGRLDASDDVVLLGLGHHGIELAKAHAEKLGHLLLLHLGLELQELERAHESARLATLLLLLAAHDGATAAQQAGGLIGLVEQDVVGVGLLGGRILGLGLGSLGLGIVLGVVLDGLNLGRLLHDLSRGLV